MPHCVRTNLICADATVHTFIKFMYLGVRTANFKVFLIQLVCVVLAPSYGAAVPNGYFGGMVMTMLALAATPTKTITDITFMLIVIQTIATIVDNDYLWRYGVMPMHTAALAVWQINNVISNHHDNEHTEYT